MSAADNAGWCTIESDPTVFTEMMESVGVKDVAVEDLQINDPATIRSLGETQYGLVLLFRYSSQVARLPRNVMPDAPNVYFAKQVISNACATQAIINTILNYSDSIDLGPELTNFHEFTQHLPAVMRGEMIGENDKLREVHNSFTRTSMFSFEDNTRTGKDEDMYHFVTFVFKNDAVWELDGMREGPIFIDSATADTWVDVASAAVAARMEELSALDTSSTAGRGMMFNLLAIVKDRLSTLRKQKQEANEKGQADAVAAIQCQIDEVEQKREMGKQENVRRRHNYFPAIISYLRALRDDTVETTTTNEDGTTTTKKTNKLQLAVDAAKQKAEQKTAAGSKK